jgi:hypothetical protein
VARQHSRCWPSPCFWVAAGDRAATRRLRLPRHRHRQRSYRPRRSLLRQSFRQSLRRRRRPRPTPPRRPTRRQPRLRRRPRSSSPGRRRHRPTRGRPARGGTRPASSFGRRGTGSRGTRTPSSSKRAGSRSTAAGSTFPRGGPPPLRVRRRLAPRNRLVQGSVRATVPASVLGSVRRSTAERLQARRRGPVDRVRTEPYTRRTRRC